MKNRQLFLISLFAITTVFLIACDKQSSVPLTPATTADLDNRIRDESVRWGKTLAQTKCTICHEESKGKPGMEVPFIGSQNADYLLATFNAYSTGSRLDEDKQRIIAGLSNEEKSALAAYYASLPDTWDGKNTLEPKRLKEYRDATLISKGKAVATPCVSCHGADGNSERSGIPSLAGLQPDYFIASLRSYLDGSRRGADVMKNFKLALSEVNIQQLAAYFTNQQRKPSAIPYAVGSSKRGEKKATTCIGCHGKDGNSFNPAFPGIAGQNSEYLQKALMHYRDKSRKETIMQKAAAKLSDRDIQDIAAYFSAQSPISLVSIIAAGERSFNPIGVGQQLANACNGCHGENGTGAQNGSPNLAGLPVEYLISSIEAYKTGTRKNRMMQMQVNFLDPLDIEKIAFYYAAQNPQVSATPDSIDYLQMDINAEPATKPTAPPDTAAACNGCHGADGVSSNVKVPSIAGQNTDYLVSAMKSYQRGLRDNADMRGAVKDLSPGEAEILANYYARQTPLAAPSRAPETPEQLAAKCDRCHGEGGTITDAKTPRIAGQSYPYLLKVLAQYQGNSRDNSTMHKMTAELSQTEIQAIAQYYADR